MVDWRCDMSSASKEIEEEQKNCDGNDVKFSTRQNRCNMVPDRVACNTVAFSGI